MPEPHEPETGPNSGIQSKKREDVPLRSEVSLRRLRQREIGQQLIVRWIAVITGAAVMLFMAFIFAYHLFYQPLLPIHADFSWVMIVVPATSLTVIATALLIAAFRRFEDKDLETARSATAAASEFSGNG